MTKYEFCSDAYLDQARRLLAQLVVSHGQGLGDETFSSCVICTDAPASLNPAPDGSVAWTMAVGRGLARITRGREDDVDSIVVGDYAGALPRARRIISGDPDERLPEEEGVRRTGDIASLSPAMRALLRAFHNALAEITA
jgi:hypothetical protein